MACAPEETQSPELLALLKNSSKLCRGITSISTVVHFALTLVEQSFITSDASSSILRTMGISEQVMCDRLLDAVKEQVRTDPAKFESFVGILRKEPALTCYTDILINSRDTEAQKCTALISHNLSSPSSLGQSISQPATEFGKAMRDLTDILQSADGAFKSMLVAFEHIAHYMKNKTYISIVQSKAYEEVDSVQALFRLLAPHLQPVDCSLLKALVEAAGDEQAIQRLDDYLHVTNDCLLGSGSEKVTTPHEMEASSPISSQPVDSTSVPVTTVVEAEEMSWGAFRFMQYLLCGIFRVPSFALQYDDKKPASDVVICTTSPEMLSQIKSTSLDDDDMLLLREKIVSIQVDKDNTIDVGNHVVYSTDQQEESNAYLPPSSEEVCPKDKQEEPTAHPLPHIEEIPSYYTYNENYPGIRFFRNPWKASVSSKGFHINWKEEIGIEFTIPPGAVPQGKELDLSVWPSTAGPFQLPEGYELASPVYLITPSFQFSCPITVTMYHYCAVETEEDSGSMSFLSSPTTPYMGEGQKPHYQFRVLGKGSFKPSEAYGCISLKHFCNTASAIKPKGKRKKGSNKGPSGRKTKAGTAEKRYAYIVCREKQFENVVVFSASLDHQYFSKVLKSSLENRFPEIDLQLTYKEPIDVENALKLHWPTDNGWRICPDRIPCEIPKKILDNPKDITYPPMIKLEIKPAPTLGTPSDHIFVDVMGVGEEKKFGVFPRLREGLPHLQSHGTSPPCDITDAATATDSIGVELTLANLELLPVKCEGREVRIISEAAVAYSQIGHYLLDDATGALVEALEKPNKFDTLREIFGKWLRRDTKKSWKKLITCLKNCQLGTLAKNVEIALNQ